MGHNISSWHGLLVSYPFNYVSTQIIEEYIADARFLIKVPSEIIENNSGDEVEVLGCAKVKLINLGDGASRSGRSILFKLQKGTLNAPVPPLN